MRGLPGRAAGAIALVASLVGAPACAGDPPSASDRRLEPIRRYRAEEARQAVAVDAEHFYAIDDRRIGKYAKQTGLRVAAWAASAGAPILHLNSGSVIDGRLYCAHSNYPGVPMRSSIEVFDARTLAHLESHDLGLLPGSATWIDRRGGVTWVGLANYAGRGGAPGRGPEHSAVVRFDADWRPQGSLAFPRAVVLRFGTRSNSGGAFGPGGFLFASGHDATELYRLELPVAGGEVRWLGTVPMSAAFPRIVGSPDSTR